MHTHYIRMGWMWPKRSTACLLWWCQHRPLRTDFSSLCFDTMPHLFTAIGIYISRKSGLLYIYMCVCMCMCIYIYIYIYIYILEYIVIHSVIIQVDGVFDRKYCDSRTTVRQLTDALGIDHWTCFLLVALNDPCVDTTDCTRAIASTSCVSGMCQCSSGYFADTTTNTSCLTGECNMLQSCGSCCSLSSCLNIILYFILFLLLRFSNFPPLRITSSHCC